ncbi:LLM class flavin-dependent oxidoreductase [Nakamurella sp. YIM 132087]|uniref:LLM class flavin-dependent oxidoreductase n=1 Tax=Nakamurella alba TaxID=2665158 RepID=A0A7K1FHA9_9ACTN|nr:LLM class flavin-dependent oxidoreductase [Nakamurella alba]MTD12673.1 LLM class flavin-dependent oxidoreductase [Nakamurella alba]
MTGQVWLHGFPVPGRTADAGAVAEDLGFDGMLLADSQHLVADPFVELAVLAGRTSTLGLGTGVINPVTRHPAVAAAAAATLQLESGGRMVLGIGRGDSALAQAGLAAPGARQLREFVVAASGFLRGDGTGEGRIGWIADAVADGRCPPVPVEVAATGPRTVADAAVHADRVMLTVGADEQRIATAVATARQARTAAGMDPADLRIGAYLNIAVHDDVHVACDLVRGSTAIFVHFSSMHPAPADFTEADAAVVRSVGVQYDEARHGLGDAGHVAVLDDDFVGRFAVVGPPEVCASRLCSLLDLGLDRIVMVAGSRDAPADLVAATTARFAAEVAPQLRI